MNRSIRAQIVFVLLCAASSACSTLPRVGEPENRLPAPPVAADQIRWPEGYRPEEAGFFVHNEIEIDAPPEVVWQVLIEAETWPTWYEGAEAVDAGPSAQLGAGSVFTWSTMGLDLSSRVTEFVPFERLSWESRKWSIKGYHAWLIVPQGSGCRVVTDESQHGFLTLMQKIFVPNKLHRLHGIWLTGIKKRAEARAAG